MITWEGVEHCNLWVVGEHRLGNLVSAQDLGGEFILGCESVPETGLVQLDGGRDFAYSGLSVTELWEGLKATPTVSNTGSVSGREIVQL